MKRVDKTKFKEAIRKMKKWEVFEIPQGRNVFYIGAGWNTHNSVYIRFADADQKIVKAYKKHVCKKHGKYFLQVAEIRNTGDWNLLYRAQETPNHLMGIVRNTLDDTIVGHVDLFGENMGHLYGMQEVEPPFSCLRKEVEIKGFSGVQSTVFYKGEKLTQTTKTSLWEDLVV